MRGKSGQKGFSAVGFLFSDSLLGYYKRRSAPTGDQNHRRISTKIDSMPEKSSFNSKQAIIHD